MLTTQSSPYFSLRVCSRSAVASCLAMVAGPESLEHRSSRRGLAVFVWHCSHYQPAHFGRVYAAYGGWFIVLSIIWGWQVDRIMPDRFDLIGGLICLSGVAIIMYWPR
jgi:drug/metabolite transporter superfamily protein YnfA